MQTSAISSVSPTKSLRARFALMMGISGLLFGIVVTGILEWRLEAFTFSAQQNSLRIVANEIGGQLASDLRARKREIALTAELLEKARLGNPAEIRGLLEKLKGEQPSYAWIGLTDSSGKVMAATDQLLEGRDTSARPWFTGAQKGIYLADPHTATLLASYMPPSGDNEPIRFVDVAAPLRDAHGQLQGVLAAHLHWAWVKKVINHVVSELESPFPLQVFIADQNGKLLLVPPGETAKSLAELTESKRNEGKYLTSLSTVSDADRASGLGWSVLARQSMSDIMAPILHIRNLMLWLAVALGCAFVMLTWIVSKRVVRPIAEFARDAHNFQVDSVEPFKTSAESRLDEVGTLARAMSALVEKLRIHTARNQLFIEHAPVPLAVFDRQMRYLSASHRWLSDYGLEGRNLIGQSHYEIFPEIPAHWRQLHKRGLAGEVLNSPGECFVRADGTHQWLRWEIRPWNMPDGTIGGIAIFSEDITARVEAEQALQASETKFRATFEQAAVGIAHVALNGQWLMVNQRLCEILEYSHNELLRKTFQDITYPDDLAADLDNVKALLAGEIAHYQMDKRYFRKSGGIVWITLTAALVRKADGSPDYFVAVVEDISERKRAENALRESEHRLRLATEAARIGIFDWDIKKRTIIWTPELEAIYGHPPSAEGATHTYEEWLQTLHPDDAADVVEEVQAALYSGEAVEHEWRIVLPNQETHWITARFQTYRDEAGHPSHMVGVNIDNTHQKNMEAELRQRAVAE